MGLTTTESINGLKRTVPACDRCGEPTAILAGVSGQMLCEHCESSAAKKVEMDAPLLAHVARSKAAVDAEREAARADQFGVAQPLWTKRIRKGHGGRVVLDRE